jgi:glycosyltransferase involved in cell wall biosynthesis
VGRFVTGLGAAPAKLVVLSNGVDGERFRPAADAAERAKLRAAYGLPGDERPLVLFVGRLVPKKGIDIAVEALEGVADLVTVGSGDASAVTGRPGVHHLGSRQPEEVAEIFRCCDMLVLPTTGEVFPLVVREAMSTGLPVVTTDEPDYTALGVDRDGMAQVPRRPEAVREAVRDLLADAARRDRMRTYSLEYAREHFSWSEHLDLLTSHYRDVAVGGGAGGEKGGPR